MKPFFAALAFLTRLPVPYEWTGNEDDLAKSGWYFPLVGVLIGGVTALIALLFSYLLPWPVASGLVVVWLLLVSGGLHIDGLADTADGFMSSRPKDRILEIMRDSRTGPMGAAAMVSVILLKYTALASLGPELGIAAAALMPAGGRFALCFLMGWLPYVREEGLGSIFQKYRFSWIALWGLAWFAAAGWIFTGLISILPIAAVTIGILIFGFYCLEKIDGITGDTLGAGCEIAEALTVLGMAVWIHLFGMHL